MNVLSLSKLFLHNWHRFDHHVIPVEGGLYLAGENGSGKTSILDALQLVLVADLQKVRFNISAQDRSSSRNLDGYVRGKIGESDYLRPASAVVGYVVLEFKSGDTVFTAGVCIEAFKEQNYSRTFFILDKDLDPENFVPKGIPRRRSELKKYLSNHGGKSFEIVSEYQDQLLNRLGGLNKRFFDLFMQALAFKPIRNVREFVEQWILPEKPLELDELQRTKEQLDRLQTLYKETVLQVEELSSLVKRQTAWRRQLELNLSYMFLAASLKFEIAQREEKDLTSSVEQLEGRLTQTKYDLADANHLYEVTQKAFIEASTRLNQSDVVRRQKELTQRRDQLEHTIRTVQEQREKLMTLWQQQRQSLQPLLNKAVLNEEERGELSTLLAQEFSETLQDAIANLSVLLHAALERTQQDLGVTRQKLNEQRSISLKIQQDIQALEAGQKQYSLNLERLRTFIARELYLPELFCEVIEVIDESWQNAIEAMLGRRRFHLLVKPEDYRQAVRFLDVARREQKIYDVAILDSEKVYAQRRPAKANSLAMYVDSENAYARAYLDSVLGNIIACDSVDELRNFERSVTREVVVYSEWSVSATDPEKYKTWYIGSRARASQLAALREKLEHIREEIFALAQKDELLDTASKLLNREGALTELKLGLAERLETGDLEAELADVERELSALDLSGLGALKQEVERLRLEQERYRQRTQDLSVEQNKLEQSLENTRYRLGQTVELVRQRELERSELNERHPNVFVTIEKELSERLAQEDWNGELRKVEIKMQEFQTRAQNEQNAFIEEATRFNTQHQFAANARDVNEVRYKVELERLQGSELPKYQSEIEKRQQSAEQELREHVLSKLFEQFDDAQRLLKQMNEALQAVDFRGERYRFRAEARDGELGEFYRLIKEWQPTLTGNTEHNEQHALFERFYQTFSRLPRDENERREQDKLKDYRHYLDYEIMVSYPDGREERFSRIMSQTSGGETQTPFYLTIAASFVQEYKPRYTGRPTLRLVVFDEAFSKMDQDRIGSALELFQNFGLQLVIATPLDRSVYIVPKMQTNLVLSRIGSRGVHVDSYYNYAVQLGGE